MGILLPCTGGNDGDREDTDQSPVINHAGMSASLATSKQCLNATSNSLKMGSMLCSVQPPLPGTISATHSSKAPSSKDDVTLTDLSSDDLSFTDAVDSQDDTINLPTLPENSLSHDEHSFESTINLSPVPTMPDQDTSSRWGTNVKFRIYVCSCMLTRVCF